MNFKGGIAIYPYESFVVSSPYGSRTDPIDGGASWHGGIDLVGVGSKEVRCALGGVVVRSRVVTDASDRTSEWGNYVAVQSGDVVIYYCHLSKRLVSAGDSVAEGDVLGIEGSTGRSTGSHLHFEVRRGNVQENPAEFLRIENKAGYTVTEGGSGSVSGGNDLSAPSSWAEEDVKWAVEAKIMQGDGQSLRLHDGITREETAVMLHRLYRLITGV